MQVLAHNPEVESYSDATGDYIKGFLIGTKLNDANWKINKQTGHTLIPKFEGTDFAIIPELINTPLSQGGGGHYFGQDTLEDLKKGYADNSHGKYHKVLGPYSYNDGTDDYWYSAIIKLRDSKAAAVMLELGPKLWEPFSISPHIMPLKGPDSDIYDWVPIGGALVVKGAYGPQAVISKLCKGTAAACEKSLGASGHERISEVLNEVSKPCEIKDRELAERISSLVSRAGNSPHNMTESKDVTTPQVTTLTAEVAKPNISSNATVNAQEAITNARIPNVVTPEQYEELSKRFAEIEKQNKQLVEDKKLNTLNNLLIKVKESKEKEELIKKWSKNDNVDQLKEFFTEFYPILRASEEEEKPAEEDKPANDKDTETGAQKKAKSKGASLPAEPAIPKEENESKAASIPVNKNLEIIRYFRSGGRA